MVTAIVLLILSSCSQPRPMPVYAPLQYDRPGVARDMPQKAVPRKSIEKELESLEDDLREMQRQIPPRK